jgi:hypothetical protein
MPSIFNRIHSRKIDLQNLPKETVSTLLIPEKLLQFLDRDKDKKVNLKLILNKLLHKYRGLMACGNLPFADKPKISYQSDGLNLQPFKFRPNHADWFELGILAYGLGVSRCWLFSFLLELESSGISEFLELGRDVVATPNRSRPRMIHQIMGRRRYINRKIHFRI